METENIEEQEKWFAVSEMLLNTFGNDCIEIDADKWEITVSLNADSGKGEKSGESILNSSALIGKDLVFVLLAIVFYL